MNVVAESNNNANLAVQTTTTAVMTNYFYSYYVAMLPWFAAAVPLILIDLILGRKKARARGEKVTIGKSIKMTIDKSLSYICWIMLSTTLSVAFSLDFIKYFIMAAIYGLEVLSALNSWFESRGFDFNEGEMLRIVFKAIWNKILGIEEDFKTVVKSKEENNNEQEL